MEQKEVYNMSVFHHFPSVLRTPSSHATKPHGWCGIWLYQQIISQGFLHLGPWGWNKSHLVAEAICYKTQMPLAAIFPMKWIKIVRENKLDTQSNQKQEIERGDPKYQVTVDLGSSYIFVFPLVGALTSDGTRHHIPLSAWTCFRDVFVICDQNSLKSLIHPGSQEAGARRMRGKDWPSALAYGTNDNW